MAAIFRGSDGDSEYVELTKKLPTSLAITLNLAGYISKLEMMHEVSYGEIGAIVRPMVLFTHTNYLKHLEISDAKTKPTEKLKKR